MLQWFFAIIVPETILNATGLSQLIEEVAFHSCETAMVSFSCLRRMPQPGVSVSATPAWRGRWSRGGAERRRLSFSQPSAGLTVQDHLVGETVGSRYL